MTDAEHLVIGSGAGGALTAALLAESARDVLVLEEGPCVDASTMDPFSLDQIGRQYRDGGLTVALGRPPIAYVEGCCAGGSTEVNAGLYRLPSEETLARWSTSHRVRDLTVDTLAPHAREVESSLSVQLMPGPATKASQLLVEGAAGLGWPAMELPRWYSYNAEQPIKQSMSRTYLPRMLDAGGRLVTGVRAEELVLRRDRVVGVRTTRGLMTAGHVWVCAGAIGTASLLQRSGLRHRVGDNLRVHPMVKLVARFKEELNAAADVSVHQVNPPGGNITLGGLVSRPSRVALTLADDWSHNASAAEDWAQSAVYYAALRPEGSGRVRALPRLRAPLVTFRLSDRDLARLANGLADLARLLFVAGASSVHPGARRAGSVNRSSDIDRVAAAVTRRSVAVMAVHLFSTAPMGEDETRCPVDSFGRVRGFRNLHVNDASLLPDAPGVNPQATIMAIASRNVAAFLEH